MTHNNDDLKELLKKAIKKTKEQPDYIDPSEPPFDPEDNMRTVIEYSPASILMASVVLGCGIVVLVMFGIELFKSI